jgi:hypothetical protein
MVRVRVRVSYFFNKLIYTIGVFFRRRNAPNIIVIITLGE